MTDSKRPTSDPRYWSYDDGAGYRYMQLPSSYPWSSALIEFSRPNPKTRTSSSTAHDNSLRTMESYNGSWIGSTTTASRRKPSMDSLYAIAVILVIILFLVFNLDYIKAWFSTRKDRRR